MSVVCTLHRKKILLKSLKNVFILIFAIVIRLCLFVFLKITATRLLPILPWNLASFLHVSYTREAETGLTYLNLTVCLSVTLLSVTLADVFLCAYHGKTRFRFRCNFFFSVLYLRETVIGGMMRRVSCGRMGGWRREGERCRGS